MKKGFLKVVTAGVVLASSVGLSACALDKDEELKYSIYNYDNTYTVNETFSLSGAKLKITNKDGSETEITITDDMIKSLPDMSTVGTKTITIVYEGNEFSLTIEVLEASVINHQITGYETSYYTNDTLNVSNLRLKLFYDNGTNETKTVTPSMIQQMPDMTTAGTKTVTILYGGESYSFTISVVEPSITGYTVTGYKQSYFTSDEFTLDNVKLNLSYNNNSHKTIDITPSMIEEMPVMTTAGTKTILVNYQGHQYQFTINVVAPSQVDYVISGYESSYFTTSTFSTDGLKLKVFYNDNSEEEVAITPSMIQQMPVMTTAGTKTIVVNYNQKQYTFTISVVKPVVLSHTITGYASSYFTSAIFTTNGLKLNLVYNDGNSASIDIVPSMIKQVPNMTIPGNKTVVVMYDDAEYQFTLTVVAPRETGRQVIGFEELYDINTQLELSEIQIKVNFEDGTHEFVDVIESMIEQMPDMSTEGIKNIFVTYNGQSTPISFEVKDIAKAEMMEKIQNFMKDYNSADVKTSGIKINVEGTAKYLEDSVEFNEQLTNIQMSSVSIAEGYEIGKIDNIYVLMKEFETWEDFQKEWCMLDFFNTEYCVICSVPSANNYVTEYGTVPMSHIEYLASKGEEMVQISLEEFKDSLQLTSFWSEDEKEISIFNSKLAKPIYKAITNAIVNATMDIKKDDIISARDNLTAQLDIIKTLQNINTNVTNIDFYNHFVNDMLLTESDSTYVELARTYIAEMFEITDQNTLDELDYALTKDIRKIRNNQLQDLETTYNMIVELNNILQESDGNASLLEKLDIIVSGIDSQDKHMLSKFVYSLKDFVEVWTYTYGETEDYEEANSGNRWCSGSRYENGKYIYTYTEEVIIEADELIEEYYAGLKSFVERFENIADYTNVKTFAYDIISDMRAMDKVVQELEENEYESEFMNFYITSSVRMAVEYYIEMYDANMIADIIDMLGQAMPEGAKQYEVLSDSMAPELWAGDKVTIEAQESYEVGDIICFNAQYKIVHRVIGKLVEDGTTYYICHGDNNQSANPSSYGYATWQDDASYIQGLINQGKTVSQIRDIAYSVQIITEEQIEGKVTGVNQMYLELPANLVEALKDCADTIYLAFGKSEVDYIKLIEDICDRLELEKDYYIEKYNAGELTIFADVFDKYMGDLSEYEGAELEFYTALKASCNYLDSVLVAGTDRTELMNEINKAVKALYNVYAEIGEECEYEQMITDIIVRLTDTEKDFNANFKDVLTEYKTIAKETVTMMLLETLNIYHDNEVYDKAQGELDHIVNYHLTAYLKDELVIGDLVADMDEFIDKYCEKDVRTYVKSFAILSTLVMNYGEDIDYNELLGNIELPNEIKDVDFNKLIKETLKDKETYDILDLQDVKVDYITDEEGNITKEILTISLNAKYDILLSAMDAKVTLTIEINF